MNLFATSIYSPIALAGLFLSAIASSNGNSSDDSARDAMIGAFLFTLQGFGNEYANAVFQEITSRYSIRGPYDLSKSDALDVMLIHQSDRWFRQFFRCSRMAFKYVVELLQHDPIFQSSGRKPQRPAYHQIAVFLHHFGAVNRHHLDTARECQVGAGTVYLYLKRVTRAIRRKRNVFIRWPTGRRREEVLVGFGDAGFPGCLGLIDGSLIELVHVPEVDPMTYYCRKKFYGINVQAVVDHEGFFTSYDIGWPASQNDITIFKRSHLWLHRSDYHLNPSEGYRYYLLADKGYQITPYTIRPYAENEFQGPSGQRQKRKKFNKKHASVRVGVEHGIGNWKGRFPALRWISGRKIKYIYRSVEALMILHNIFLDYGDDPTDIADFYRDDPDVRALQDENNPWAPAEDREGYGAATRRVLRRLTDLETPDDLRIAGCDLRETLLEQLT